MIESVGKSFLPYGETEPVQLMSELIDDRERIQMIGDHVSIERLHTSPRMSKIVKHNGVAYLCGQVGNADGSVADQTRECLRRVEGLLEEAGSSKEHILQAIIWLADMSDFQAMNEVWDAWVPAGHAPARACGEAQLARPALKVEITITAACT